MGTTISKLKKNICYCTIQSKDIKLKDCKGVECYRWKTCMKKTNNEIDKELKKRGDKNRKKI